MTKKPEAAKPSDAEVRPLLDQYAGQVPFH
jgi:hypothetical protein